jgi:hypothetical protein
MKRRLQIFKQLLELFKRLVDVTIHVLLTSYLVWAVSFTPRTLYPWGKSPQYTLDRRLGRPQGRFRRGENSWSYRDSNSVASRYINCDIPVPLIVVLFYNLYNTFVARVWKWNKYIYQACINISSFHPIPQQTFQFPCCRQQSVSHRLSDETIFIYVSIQAFPSPDQHPPPHNLHHYHKRSWKTLFGIGIQNSQHNENLQNSQIIYFALDFWKHGTEVWILPLNCFQIQIMQIRLVWIYRWLL